MAAQHSELLSVQSQGHSSCQAETYILTLAKLNSHPNSAEKLIIKDNYCWEIDNISFEMKLMF